MDDIDLLDRYRRHGDHEVFAELVRRHSDWIYASARRQLGDAHLAEDTTQAVFLLLARKAARLAPRSNLGGWLFGTLRHCISEAHRQRSRQQHREKEAAQMRQDAKPDATWEDISPLLDHAIARLRKSDREAILLRFYQRKPLAEVGQALGTTEEAARKRVDRAIEKLRQNLAARGVGAEALSLSALILTDISDPGPAGLVERITASIAQDLGHSAAGTIAKGAAKMMALTKVKVAAVVLIIAAGLALAGNAARAAATRSAADALLTEIAASPTRGWVKITPDQAREPMWLAFQPFRTAGRGNDGTIALGSSGGKQFILRNEGTGRKTIYDAQTNQITISPMNTEEPHDAANLLVWVQGTFSGWKAGHPDEVMLERGQRTLDGQPYLSLSATLPNGMRLSYLVDQQARRIARVMLGHKSTPQDAPFASVEYPDSGPDDIYALGAPRDAKIVDLMPTLGVKELDQKLDQARASFAHSYYAIVCWTTASERPSTQVIVAVYKKGDRCRYDWWSLGPKVMLRERALAEKWMREHIPYELQFLEPGQSERIRRRIDTSIRGAEFDGRWRIEELGWDDAHSFATGNRLATPDEPNEQGLILRTAGPGSSIAQRHRWYYDPKRDYLCVRRDVFNDDPATHQPVYYFGDVVLETAQTADGKWYPRVRADKNAKGEITSYLDIYVDTQRVIDDSTFDIDQSVASYRATPGRRP